MLDKLERSKLSRWAIPNLTVFLVIGQLMGWAFAKIQPQMYGGLVLVPARVLQGEVWRLVSFLFTPPPPDAFLGDIGVLIALYLVFLFGRALEAEWGSFRFNVFILVGWLTSVAAAFVSPFSIATNLYLMESIFFAFAYLNPNFELLLMFIFPVKVKWLALLGVASCVYVLVTGIAVGSWGGPALVLATFANLTLFFGRDAYLRIKGRARRTAHQRAVERDAAAPNHTCTVCGIDDLSAPTMVFRYCSKCEGKHGYCADHLRDHEHVRG